MRNLIFVVVAVLLLCQCKRQENYKICLGHEIDTTCFNRQFLSIVDEYVKSHSFYDSYLIISSNTLSKDNVAKSNEKEQKLYYITPAALEYEIDVSDDSLAIFNCFSDECLSFFFIVDDKPVYIASDLDDLSYKRVSRTGIKQKICTQNTSGGIWCFMLSGDKCSVLSKDVENDGYWRGFLLTKLAHGIRFDPPTLK